MAISVLSDKGRLWRSVKITHMRWAPTAMTLNRSGQSALCFYRVGRPWESQDRLSDDISGPEGILGSASTGVWSAQFVIL